MAGFPSTVSQFWGEEISESKPAEYAPDPEGDLTLQITGISFADGNANKGETYIVSMSADDSPPYTIAILRPGKTDQVQVDVLLGSGNEKVEFFVKGGKAKIHLTGFEILEDNGDDDFDEENQLGGLDEDDDDDDEVGIGMYILIAFAALVVVVMYSWMGWTLYQGIKEGKKQN
mmetsp:Transcript_19401/g.23975  ORF Transcript_19401/g.23975 Transcript_19401/m.23975 type:complete len:174 (+) Transcript_19401:82-603(+)